MAISDPGRGLVRRLGVTAAALLAFAAASQQRAEALSLASPGTAPSAKFATDDLTTEVRHGGHGGGGGGGFRGGGFHGGGFRGGGAAFHGGGFRGGGVAIHRGGFRAAPVFHGGGMRYGVRRVYHRPTSTTGITFTGGSTRRAITDTRITMATGTATAA
jgi:hypothetical protein